MSLRPIDLQILFGRLNEISSLKAAAQEAKEHAQKVSGSEIAEQSLRKENQVNKTEMIPEGPDQDQKISVDEDTSEDMRRSKGRARPKKQLQNNSEEEKVDIFKDPDLGNRIDIST